MAVKTPSKFQQSVYDFVQFSVDNLFVEAVAGSGKTQTLVGVCERLTPAQLGSAIFLAFSKAIQVELQTRLPREVWVKTFHANCMYWLQRAVQPKVGSDKWINDHKYTDLIRDMLDHRGYAKGDDRSVIEDALGNCVRYARLTLVDMSAEDAFQAMLAHYDIDDIPGLRPMTADLLRVGAEEADQWIDYTDMIWLPIHLNISLKKFAFIMVDEAQDLSACQREILRRMMFPTSRVIAVGDRFQAIFGFAGAGVDSVDRIIEDFHCESLPLSVCYRCHRKAIAAAQVIVPQIEAHDGAAEGTIEFLKYEEIFSRVNAARGDMVICRSNAPLVDLAFALIAAGIPAAIKGRDLMGQLVNLAKSTMKLPGANWNQFQSYLTEYVNRQVTSMSRKKGMEMRIQALHDRSQALSTIVNRAQALDRRISTMDGLEKFIERLYGEEKGSVILCSAHKAKGLEADAVFILGRHELMPSRMARSAWQQTQEMNLIYVAETRAKLYTGYVQLPPKEDN